MYIQIADMYDKIINRLNNLDIDEETLKILNNIINDVKNDKTAHQRAMKKYLEKNKDNEEFKAKVKEARKRHYEKNKENIIEKSKNYNCQKVECMHCHMFLNKNNLKRHIKNIHEKNSEIIN